MIDPILYKDLQSEKPEDVLNRCDATYDAGSGAYGIQFWGHDVRVIPASQKVVCPDISFEGAWAYVPLILVHYLLSAGKPSDSGDWVSEKDLPGGTAFFRGPHTLPAHLVAEAFEKSLDAFKQRCQAHGGTPLDMADAAFSFPLLPGIPGAVLFWQADEMFGAEAKLLFDRSISDHLPLDIIYALGVTLCRVVAVTDSPR